MFGYVNINKPELKMKDFYKYKAYYCGLCNTLRKKYGRIGQMTLSYDMTFLIILLTSLYESNTVREQKRCILHPVKRHDTLYNEITEYVADMNIALTYHHFMDDWQDEKSMAGLTGSRLLQGKYRKIRRRYPRQCNKMKECLSRLKEYEINQETNIDLISGCFGELMSELFTYREDIWEDSLRRIGFYLGKFIYLLDAYDDIKKDIKNNSFNPLRPLYQMDSFEAEIKEMLTLMIAECTVEFEKLPCLIDIDILRNILYEGVWTKFNKISEERINKEGNNDDYKSIQGA